ncbi:MAG: box helicase [Bacteroidetes bacterium]|nr:box helicase [Bacteroidota bacterium]MDF2451430.1 box helicase [Bacteroidota bacterium]
MTFNDFNFDQSIIDGLQSMGYKLPTPIQQQAMPVIQAGKDLIACAQTGTGKTAAFVLPILDKIIKTKKGGINTLIIAPTRELVLQIDQQIEGMAYFCGVSSIGIYGGNDGIAWGRQASALREGVDIVIATPGRLIALLQSGDVKFDTIEHLILDEADRMLDMGFADDIKTILNYVPTKRQTIMFSATMAPKIRILAGQLLQNHESINIAISKPAAGIVQQAYVVYDNQKEKLLKEILKNEDFSSVIIFSSTKEKVKELAQTFTNLKYSVKGFSSDLDQMEREAIMRDFKAKKVRILIGTDILSRGIDVIGISLVVNFDAPPDPEDYIHRIGRTARAERAGVAITFINEKDQPRFAQIEALMGIDVPKMPIPEEFGAGPEYNPDAAKKKFDKPRGFSGNKSKPGFKKKPFNGPKKV